MVKKRISSKFFIIFLILFVISILLLGNFNKLTGFVSVSNSGILKSPSIFNIGDYFLNIAGNVISISETISVTSCINISSSGEYVLEDSSIADYNPGDNNGCININSSDIIFDCQGNTIDGQDTGSAIRIVGESGSHITNITIKNCDINDFSSGIFIEYVSSSIIEDSSINSPSSSGIYSSFSSFNLFRRITGTNAQSNLYGRASMALAQSDNNNITDSIFENNYRGIVISGGSDDNRIYSTNITDNTYGIVPYGNEDNYIYNNFFNNINNSKISSDSSNYFNTELDCTEINIIGELCIAGNYWANPSGTGVSENCIDANDNAICDDIYDLGYDNVDNYPLTYRGGDAGAPISILDYPEDEYGIKNGTINFSCTGGDSVGLASITFYLWDSNSNLIKNITTDISGTLSQANFSYDFVINDNYLWNCLIEDSDSNIDWGINRTIYAESTLPSISISYPIDGNTYSSYVTQLDFSATDEHLNRCWYNLNDYLGNIEVPCNQSVTGIESINGWYNWTVYAEDLSGNIGSKSIEIKTDAPLDLRINTSRTECIAPCGIFFDVTITKGLLENDYVNPHFTWDFGDPSTETWIPTGKSKNKAYGFIASHIYENPGTYTVSLNLKDVEGNEHNDNTIQINVLAEPSGGWDTTCISREGNFEECPVGATQKQTTNTIDVTNIINNTKNNSRILFKRGDIWNIETYASSTNNIFAINQKELIEIGSYGEGERPKIYHMNDPDMHESLFSLYESRDIRFNGIELGARHNTGWNALIYLYSTSDHALISNMTFNGTYRVGINAYAENVFISDSNFYFTDYLSIYGPAPKTSIIGNVFSYPDVSTDSRSGIRLASIVRDRHHPGKTIFSNNYCFRDGAWCLRAYNGPLVVSDNIMNGTASMSTLTALCQGCDPGTKNNLIERNVFYSPEEYASEPGPAVGMGSKDIGVIRNNIFYNALSTKISLSYVPMDQNPGPGNYGNESDKLYVYHNVVYNHDITKGMAVYTRTEANLIDVRNNIFYNIGPSDQYHSIIRIDNFSKIQNLTIDNNLWYSPNIPKPVYMNGISLNLTAWSDNFNISYNELCSQDYDDICDDYNPKFLNTNSLSPNFMKINESSPAYNSGANIPVFEDRHNNPRPYDTGWDIGANEYTFEASAYCGDSSCNNGETCSSCSSDCGECAAVGDDSGSNNGGAGGISGAIVAPIPSTDEKEPAPTVETNQSLTEEIKDKISILTGKAVEGIGELGDAVKINRRLITVISVTLLIAGTLVYYVKRKKGIRGG